MPKSSDKCPNCGAPLPALSPGILTLTCEYCGAVTYREADAEGLSDSGKRSLLSEGFTRLYRGATGVLRSKRIRVQGRVRYGFGNGFWDEWYITFDEEGPHSGAWVTEDDHTLALQTPLQNHSLNASELETGNQVELDGTRYLILEKGQAECMGTEGQLPIAILPDDAYPYIDGTSLDGKYALGIEQDDEGPTVLYLGEWLDHHDVLLDDDELQT